MFRPSYSSHSQHKTWSSFLELSPLLLYFCSSPWMSWWSILLSVLTDLYESFSDLNIWVNWVNALMSLWVRVHWSVGAVHWWSVVVVHILLISLICWVKHKFVYTSVSCDCLCLRFEFFILWQLVVAWSSWVEWCMTVSFFSLEWWLTVSLLSLLLLSFLSVVRGLSVKVKFHFEFVQYLGTKFVLVSQCHCQSISEIKQSLIVTWPSLGVLHILIISGW